MIRPTFPSYVRALRPATIGAFLLVALGIPGQAAALDVIGNINSDTTWHKTDSPVRLTGDVTVQSFVTLTIEPGTLIQAAATDGLGSGTDTARVEFIVKGRLLADGTATDHIVIQGATSGASVWYGMVFDPIASNSSVTFVDLRDAAIGIYSRTQKPLTLSDFSIANSASGFRWQASPGPTMTRGTFINSSSVGIQLDDDGTSGAQATLTAITVQGGTGTGLKLGPRVSAAVNRSLFSDNQIGIDAGAGSAITLTNSVLAYNRQIGLLANQSAANVFTIINNTIDRNNALPSTVTSAGVGVRAAAVSDASKFILRNNNVTNHGTVGIDVIGGVSPSIDHNNVWNNVMNYAMGVAAGTGSISTNPLYRGLSNPTQVSGGALSHLNYPNGDNFSFSCGEPTAFALRISFTSFQTEANFDKVVIQDSAGNISQTLSGNLGSFISIPVDGNKLTLKFTSDGSTTGSGFAGNCEYLAQNYRLAPSSPAIDVGNALMAPAADFDAIARPIDGDNDGAAAFDIGAFEYHANKAPTSNAGPDRFVHPNTMLGFDGRLSADPDGSIVSYSWNFGDGSPAAMGAQTSHQFAMVGPYTVTLTVTDDQGQTATDTAVITVTTNLPPTANAGPDQAVAVGAQVSFDGGASTDPDGTVVVYAWNFGDGTPAGSGPNVTHTYASAGTYTATLTVTDNLGTTNSDIATITVGSGGSDGGTMSGDGGTGSPGVDLATAPGSDGGVVPPGGPGGSSASGCSCNIGQGRPAGATAALAMFLLSALLLLRRRSPRTYLDEDRLPKA